MAQTARAHRNRFGWGIQTAEGTPMTTNASLYETSMEDGGIDINEDEVPFELSDANDLPADFYLRRHDWSADPTIPLDVDSFGSLQKLHLGTDTPSGGGPYTHVLTKADGKVFGTFYEMKPGVTGGTDYWIKANDGFVRGVEVTAGAGEFLRAKLDVIGKSAVFNPTTTPSPTRDMRAVTTSPTGSYATMIGSTLQLTTGATINNIENLVISTAYPNAEWIQTDEHTPRFLNLGPFSIGYTATVILTAVEFQTLAGTFYGTTTIASDMTASVNPATPTAISSTFTFNTIGATASRSVAWLLPAMRLRATFPKVQPSGDAVRVTLTATSRYHATAITCTAINNRATY